LRSHIAPTDETHVEGFHAALDRVAREKKYLAMFKAPPLRDIRKFVLNNIRKENPGFVALAGDEVVGWCDVVRRPQAAWMHCGVLGIAVVPEYRGKGLGERLMKKTIAASWARDFTRIELTVREDNRRAICLYGRLGFKLEGVLRRSFRVDGEYGNALAMALLREGPRERG
jgi:ribosomal protein S18 acetylase RimI-like enzyme